MEARESKSKVLAGSEAAKGLVIVSNMMSQ